MAGGMTPGGRQTLAERVVNTRARQARHGTAGAHGKRPTDWADVLRDTAPGSSAPLVRHCWHDGPNGRQAALLLQWRNIGGRYDGRIAVAAQEPGAGWGIVEMWVGGAMLSPVTA